MRTIETVTIAGVGLIGGSFALALRKVGYPGRLLGVSSPATLSRALELGVIDEARSLEDALPRSDLVYMAQPVLRILAQLERVRDLVPDHALVTDAGSTKQAIVDRARELFRGGADFLGGHPMAGKEGRGVEIADAGLFSGATYALVPIGSSVPESPVVAEFRGWLEELGCHVNVMSAAEHDRTVAWTSHLPQLVSTALASTLAGRLQSPSDLEVSGDGLRDMTRLAASPHEVWAEILETNREAIDEALGEFIGEVEALRSALPVDAAKRHFARGQSLRARLPRK